MADVNPSGIQPDISLGVKSGLGGSNPLDMMRSLAETQNAMNQNKLFQQQFQARQQAGRIIAASPDMDTAIKNLMADPTAAPFAGETISAFRGAQLALQQLHGAQQDQSNSAQKNVLLASGVGLVDPTQFGPAIDRALTMVPKANRDAIAPYFDSLKTTLAPLAKSDPAAFRQQLTGALLGAGFGPENIRAITGTLPPQVVSGQDPTGAPQTSIIGGPAAGGGNALGAGAPEPGQGASPQPSGTGTPVFQGPTQTQAEFNKARGTDMADYVKRLDTTVQTMGQNLKSLEPAYDALKQIKAGGGAGTYARLGELAQAFGAPPDLVDKISNGNLAASQEFEKLMVNTTMSQIQSQLPDGSRIAQQEFFTFNKNNPNLNTDPRAIEKIFNFWTKIYNQSADEQKTFADERKKPGFDVQDWPSIWQGLARKKGYINTNVTGTADKPSRPPIESFFK